MCEPLQTLRTGNVDESLYHFFVCAQKISLVVMTQPQKTQITNLHFYLHLIQNKLF